MKINLFVLSSIRAIAIFASTLTAAIAATPSTEALTLDQYYAAALQRSEVVATQGELIRQAEERYSQASGAILPSVNGIASYTVQDPIPAGTTSTSPYPNRARIARITAAQPLFRGFREFAALRQTKALMSAQSEDYEHARVQLFKDVTENFYNILSIEQDLKNLDEQINQNLKREAELRDRARIGRSRVGEVLSVQSAISTLRAQVELLQGQRSAAREAFAFLSGLDATSPLRDTEELPDTLDPLEDYLKRLEMRPDVRATALRVTASEENVSVQRGAHLPSLDLYANRYLERTGSLQDVEWDVQLALTIPIYAGGQLQSRIREATSQQTQAELGASQVRRQAEQEIRSMYQNVVFDQTQLDALQKATDAARKNYETQRQDYRLGLVTNLDVLQALTNYQENQRALDRARFTTKTDYMRLQAAAVRRPMPEEGAKQ